MEQFDAHNTTIVIVGVSADPEKYGNKLFVDMLKAGWDVYGVNPKKGIVAGRVLYPNLTAVPVDPDLVVCVVPPLVTEQIVEEARNLGISHIWMQPGSESQKAIKKAESFGMEVTANACIMVRSGLW